MSNHPTPAISSDQSEGLSMREVMTIIFERKWSVLAINTSVLATTVFLLYVVLSPKYETSTTLMINFADIVRPLVNAPPKSDFEKVTDFHTQLDILSSTRLTQQVVDQLELDKTRVLSNLEKFKLRIRAMRAKLGQWLNIEKWQKPWDARSAAIAAIEKQLRVESSPESKIIEINYRAFSPTEAQQTLSTLLTVYEDYYYHSITREAEGILAYIKAQIDSVGHDLATVEQEILAFKQNRPALTRQSPAAPKDSNEYYSSLNITDSLTLQDEYKLYILQLEEELRHLQQTVPKNDPKVLTLRNKLEHMLAKINDLPEQELKITQLSRKRELSQDKYLLLARNLNQAQLITMGQLEALNLIEILKRPEADDRPVSPKKRLILAFSVILALALSFAWCYLAYFLDHRIRTPRDIRQFLGMRCLGSLAELS